jgi:hypothetical protein
MKDKTLDKGIRFTLAEVKRAGDDLSKLPRPLQIVALVHAAQGIIDNGGLQYFFEADFLGTPPYSVFSDAYRTIGATSAADAFDQAVSMFGSRSPHKHRIKRNHFLDAEQKRPGKFSQLSNSMCGDKQVWELLGQFVAEQASVFERSPTNQIQRTRR